MYFIVQQSLYIKLIIMLNTKSFTLIQHKITQIKNTQFNLQVLISYGCYSPSRFSQRDFFLIFFYSFLKTTDSFCHVQHHLSVLLCRCVVWMRKSKQCLRPKTGSSVHPLWIRFVSTPRRSLDSCDYWLRLLSSSPEVGGPECGTEQMKFYCKDWYCLKTGKSPYNQGPQKC